MPRRWITNTFTVINLFAGLAAIILACVHQWTLAVAIIFGAALFDNLDGRIARRLNLTSEFGKQLDSLADWFSFGVAPAIITCFLVFTGTGWSGPVLSAVFPICGALRLARFNVSAVKSHYVGLPITAAGPILAISALLARTLPTVEAIILLVLSGLMVSRIKIPKL